MHLHGDILYNAEKFVFLQYTYITFNFVEFLTSQLKPKTLPEPFRNIGILPKDSRLIFKSEKNPAKLIIVTVSNKGVTGEEIIQNK